MEQDLYEGRKGFRRLKAIEKQVKRVNEEFEHRYGSSPEMTYLEDEVNWEGMSLLIFTMAFRNVNFRWNGLRDYGFLRLCVKWLTKRQIDTVTSDMAFSMIESILPRGMCVELKEELAALEI